VGSASVFSVSANGSLCASPACVQQTQGIVADARAALRVSPELRFKWQLGGTKENFMAVWNSTERTDRLVAELAAFTHANSDVAHGITLDYEEHYRDNESAVKHGMTAFLRKFKESTGHGTNWWGDNFQFKNLADVAAVQPYIDFVEFNGYFDDDQSYDSKSGWNPHVFELNHATELIQKFGYKSSQILLGIGLSSYSWMNTPKSVLAECAWNGRLGCCPGCAADQGVHCFASNRASHSSLGGSGFRGQLWDKTVADIQAGRAVKWRYNSTRGSYEPYDMSSYGLFYPSAANASVGELTFFNDVPDLERFTDTAKRLDFAGVYTWVATSDALDWRVHRRLWKALNAD